MVLLSFFEAQVSSPSSHFGTRVPRGTASLGVDHHASVISLFLTRFSQCLGKSVIQFQIWKLQIPSVELGAHRTARTHCVFLSRIAQDLAGQYILTLVERHAQMSNCTPRLHLPAQILIMCLHSRSHAGVATLPGHAPNSAIDVLYSTNPRGPATYLKSMHATDELKGGSGLGGQASRPGLL